MSKSSQTLSAWASLFSMLVPLAEAIDERQGWGQSGAKAELTRARIQNTQVRTMREISREQRDRDDYELKQALLVARIEKMELENERLRRELGQNAKPFNPSY